MTKIHPALSSFVAAIVACTVSAPASADEPPGKVEIVFDDLGGPHRATVGPAPGEGAPAPDLVGKRVELSGQLHDTGSVNLFNAHFYNGYRIVNRRYPVHGRPLKRPAETHWARVAATVLKRGGRHELKIHTITHPTVEENDVLARATAEARRWVSDHHDEIDLNKFKGSTRFQNLNRVLGRGKLAALDLNKLPVREADWTVRVDLRRQVAEILGVRYLLNERPHQTETWLDLIVVYDLKAKRPVRVIIDEDGYFLE